MRSRGGELLEGYPVELRTKQMPDVFAWTGFASALREAGFKEVARRSASRTVLRFDLQKA